jgi:curved DNA-binding protein CbpA
MFMINLGAESYYSILGVAPDATSEEIQTAAEKIVVDLKKRLRSDPSSKEELMARETKVNSARGTLAGRKKREEYDRANAHLRFFTIRRAAAGMFLERADRIHVLHRAVREHLASRGVSVMPMTDLDRQDFSMDESPNSLLDELLK